MEIVMGDVVSFPTSLEDNQEFVADCCRYAENILSEEAVRKKWRFDTDVWAKLGGDEKLIAAIEAEKVRRVRTGQQKRERAQVLVTQAPDVLSGILLDPNASPRHRIDSAKTLDDFAANGPAGPPAGDRFSIVINLGDDHVLHFDKSIAVDANDVDPFNDVDTGVIAAIAAKKKDDGDGNPV
jgi:hypothetical protein